MNLNTRCTIDLHENSTQILRSKISNNLIKTFELEESLFSLLKNDEAFYKKPEPLRHPLIFYFGHTPSFYINKLFLGKYIQSRVNPVIESMMAVGVDEMSWDDLDESHYDWPTISELWQYREKVLKLLIKFVENVDFQTPVNWESPLWPIIMGIEHHNIHIETSSVLIRQHSLKYISESKLWKPCHLVGLHPQNDLYHVEAGVVKLGKTFNSSSYGWDNEYGDHKAQVKPFKAAQYLISNGEYLEFIEDGGYQTPEYWCEEALAWLKYKKAVRPVFWIKKEGEYFLRVIDREIKLPLNWPVELNYLESKAFCNWKSIKTGRQIVIPTEDQWYLMLESSKKNEKRNKANLDLKSFASPCPVDLYKTGDFYDLTGNIWQWTQTPIYPFEGFKTHDLYEDFTTPTFDERHNLLKGGSFISTGNEADAYSRYAFRKHFYQHAGCRYIEVSP